MKTIQNTILLCFALTIGDSVAASQIATGGAYALDQQVFANGGSNNGSSGGTYAVQGTIGQSIAGAQANSGNYIVDAGFWQALLGPTAAYVTVSGRVVTAKGMGIGGVRLTLLDGSGRFLRQISSPFGYFKFDNVEAGQTYLLSASSKQYVFAAQAVNVNDAIGDLNVVAVP